MKYRSQWPTFIFRSNIGSYWLIIPKYDVRISNSLQDIRQNHWTLKYRSQWPTFILRSKVVSYWLIILKNDVHAANSFWDVRQNQWTMKYRSQWPTFIFRSNVGSYWLISRAATIHSPHDTIRIAILASRYVSYRDTLFRLEIISNCMRIILWSSTMVFTKLQSLFGMVHSHMFNLFVKAF